MTFPWRIRLLLSLLMWSARDPMERFEWTCRGFVLCLHAVEYHQVTRALWRMEVV